MWFFWPAYFEVDWGGSPQEDSGEREQLGAQKDIPMYCPRCGEYKWKTDPKHPSATSQPCVWWCDSMEKSLVDAIWYGWGTDFPIKYDVRHISQEYRTEKGILQELQLRGYSEVSEESITISESWKRHIKDHRDAVYGEEREFLKLIQQHTPEFLMIIDEWGETHYLRRPPSTKNRSRVTRIVEYLLSTE